MIDCTQWQVCSENSDQKEIHDQTYPIQTKFETVDNYEAIL